MKKSILLTSLIAVFCFSVLLTAPAAASLGDEAKVETNLEDIVSYDVFLPLVIRDNGVPKLVSPMNGSTLNSLIPTFLWEEIEIPTGMAITVEVSEYTDFSPRTTSISLLSGNSVTVFQNLEPATKYFWHAFLYRWSDQTRFPYSETWTFTTPSSGVLPDSPTLKSPAHVSIIESSPIILESNQVPGAIEYQFWYKESESFITYVSSSNTPQLTIPDYFTLTADTDYVWWVKAKNNYGYGISSSTWSFSMASDYTSDAAAKGEIEPNLLMYDEETNTFTQQ